MKPLLHVHVVTRLLSDTNNPKMLQAEEDICSSPHVQIRRIYKKH